MYRLPSPAALQGYLYRGPRLSQDWDEWYSGVRELSTLSPLLSKWKDAMWEEDEGGYLDIWKWSQPSVSLPCLISSFPSFLLKPELQKLQILLHLKTVLNFPVSNSTHYVGAAGGPGPRMASLEEQSPCNERAALLTHGVLPCCHASPWGLFTLSEFALIS